jgi:hypothetical protein
MMQVDGKDEEVEQGLGRRSMDDDLIFCLACMIFLLEAGSRRSRASTTMTMPLRFC